MKISRKFLSLILFAVFLGLLVSIFIITSDAQEEQVVPIQQDSQLNQYLNSVPIPKIPPGHLLYGLKLRWELLQEKLTFSQTKLLQLRQEHLQNRIDELKFDITYKNSQHAEELLQRIQVKRVEIDGEGIVPEYMQRTNNAVLFNLLNDSRMPESSRKGLENAMNNSGMMREVKEIKANMVQGAYQVSNSAIRMLPFSKAMLYVPSEKKWYSILVFSNKIEITDSTLSQPEYYLYPTQKQVEEFTQLVDKINKQGKITTKDKITLTKLWFTLQKKEVS